ncbi:MAG: RNA-binding protein [Gammaproteobacteria bacterium]|nr:RNA-binding protein [Gammaproteobacteria bacterium]MCB1860726.1 RNA-binding protein [Gammaproteobacteria bacterium]MCB1871478.1 RNA-binding protein [Gammaproteobacteria bacterium]MCB1879993.1 RNA-binding protein [Gammaproteobacteria bacterium]MCB1904014.1 RNA-binding protein [Gammaproteobacteria bacterium]
MRVFICSLPESTTEQEIRQFVLTAICSPLQRLLRRHNRITSLEIIEITNLSTHSTEYHAIVEFEQPQIAELAIKKLNGGKLKNQPIKVRQYQTRSTYRDRRRQNSEVPLLAIHNRRKAGRRRLNLYQRTVRVSGFMQPGNSGQPYALEMESSVS